MPRAETTDRIRIDRNKSRLVTSLKASQSQNGPFQTYADIVNFAAAVGLKNGKRIPISEPSNHEPDPIPQDQFGARGYFSTIDLVLLLDSGSPRSLSQENYHMERARIFEEYANAGFEILENALRGVPDVRESLLLFLSAMRLSDTSKNNGFNLDEYV